MILLTPLETVKCGYLDMILAEEMTIVVFPSNYQANLKLKSEMLKKEKKIAVFPSTGLEQINVAKQCIVLSEVGSIGCIMLGC